nr:MAG TPA: hypothetical protein [Caudoviricetes sp.]
MSFDMFCFPFASCFQEILPLKDTGGSGRF